MESLTPGDKGSKDLAPLEDCCPLASRDKNGDIRVTAVPKKYRELADYFLQHFDLRVLAREFRMSQSEIESILRTPAIAEYISRRTHEIARAADLTKEGMRADLLDIFKGLREATGSQIEAGKLLCRILDMVKPDGMAAVQVNIDNPYRGMTSAEMDAALAERLKWNEKKKDGTPEQSPPS